MNNTQRWQPFRVLYYEHKHVGIAVTETLFFVLILRRKQEYQVMLIRSVLNKSLYTIQQLLSLCGLSFYVAISSLVMLVAKVVFEKVRIDILFFSFWIEHNFLLVVEIQKVKFLSSESACILVVFLQPIGISFFRGWHISFQLGLNRGATTYWGMVHGSSYNGGRKGTGVRRQRC